MKDSCNSCYNKPVPICTNLELEPHVAGDDIVGVCNDAWGAAGSTWHYLGTQEAPERLCCEGWPSRDKAQIVARGINLQLTCQACFQGHLFRFW